MSFYEALRLAAASIFSHKLRSFLTLLGIIFGVATVIVVVSVIEGFNAYVDEKIANIGTNAFSVSKFSVEDFSSVASLNAARRRNKDITRDDLKALKSRGGAIADAGGKSETLADIKYKEETLLNVQLKATTPNIADIEKIEAASGRYFLNIEEEKRKFVCFIGSEIAEKLFPTANPIGKKIKIDGRTFKVVGVGEELGSAFGQSRDMYASIPLSTFLSIYGVRRSISISVTSANPESYEDAIDEARTLMRVRRKLEPSEDDNFGIITPGAINELRDKIFGTIQIAAIGVTSISLIVGGIVIMNIMLVTVTERRKEIGIRKSIGAKQSDIIKQFLLESTTLALVGGAIGVLIAYSIAMLIAILFAIPTALPFLWVTIALIVSSGVGLISGVYPAWKAANLNPIEAMRAE
ncbi:MAG: FtsX-like permease family protein [Pyrinomonadaceae bacterium]|nr:FtsX-like permease family protein [Pyrinomonadaceae bacterium]